MPPVFWYNNYEKLRAQVDELRRKFLERCKELSLNPDRILGEFTREILIRAVHESNWQEGIELDSGKTQELASCAFDELEDIAGPHLDMNKVLRFHRNSVLRLKKDGASVDELAAYNLARAYHAIVMIGWELSERQSHSVVQALRGVQRVYQNLKEKMPREAMAKVEKAFAIIDDLESTDRPVDLPMTARPATLGNYTKELLKLDSDELLHPMRSSYIHFLHKLVLMGTMPQTKCGRFRKISVHVGNPDIYFPVPSAVPELMREYCRKFPTILPTTVKYDPILVAAKASHKFVSIHPYADGNGRVSRLLMNLVLWGHFPPVYLKADEKGRHRYSQAIRRADRGNIKPLASLIAMSLIEIFEKLLQSLRVSRTA